MEEAAGTPPLEPVVAPLSTTGKEGWRRGAQVEEGEDLADEDRDGAAMCARRWDRVVIGERFPPARWE